jgi:hypothetical protein
MTDIQINVLAEIVKEYSAIQYHMEKIREICIDFPVKRDDSMKIYAITEHIRELETLGVI